MTTLCNPSQTGIPETKPMAGRGWRSGFSLIEIMIVVGLLSVIILGLMGMFSQTQRAFQLGMSQTDVLESGRIATDLIVRELAQITPGDRSIGPNAMGGTSTYRTCSGNITRRCCSRSRAAPPLAPIRCKTCSFLERENQTWTGIGYCVRTNPGFASGSGPAGTLYRFEASESKQNFRIRPSAHDRRSLPAPAT